MSGYAVNAVFSLIDQFSGPAGGIVSATDKMRGGTNALSNSVMRLGGYFSAAMVAKRVFDKQIEVDSAMLSLSAITGVSGEAFEGFAAQIEKTAKELRVFKGDLAGVYEIVGSKMPELLSNPAALDDVSRTVVNLRKITKGATDEGMANSLTTIMNQMGAASDEAAHFGDVLATMQQKGSGNIEYMATMMLKAGADFRSTNHTFQEAAVAMQMFAKAGIGAEVASTQAAAAMVKLRSAPAEFNIATNKLHEIAIKMAQAGYGYDEISKITGGEVQATRGLMNLVNQAKIGLELSEGLEVAGGMAGQLETVSKSLANRLLDLSNAFDNATTTADTNSVGLAVLGWMLAFVTDNMDVLIDFALAGAVVWAGYKVAVWAAGVATYWYTKQAAAARVQMALAAVGSVKATAATTLLAAATGKLAIATNLAAAPVWLIVAAVAAAIGTIMFAVKNLMFLWELVTRVFNVFKAEGFVAGIKAAGIALFEFLVQPLRIAAGVIDSIASWFGADLGLKMAFDKGIEAVGGSTAAERNAEAAREAAKEVDTGLAQKTEISKEFRKEVNENNLTIDFANMPDWINADVNNKSLIQAKSTMRGGR
jgi:TP901 family phage tail tape measure protein